MKISEYEVTHRDLYTATSERAPVKNGVLDRRLVSGRLASQVVTTDL